MTKNFIDDALEFFPSKGFTVKRTGRDQAVVLKDGLPHFYLQPSTDGHLFAWTDVTAPPNRVDRSVITAFADFVKRPRLPTGWDETKTAGQRMFMHLGTKAIVFVPDPLTAEGKKALADMIAYLGT